MMNNNNGIFKRKIVKVQIDSKYLNKPRSLRIFLPPGYDELLSYPVIYCQDGEQFFNFGRVATIASEQILEHDMEPCIIVGIDVDVKIRTEEYSPEGMFFHNYCAFVAEELVPYIENHFSARKTADARILAGDSLGATVSLHLAVDYPDLFRHVLSFSGAFLAPSHHHIRSSSGLSGIDIYMLIGRQETEVQTDRGTFNFLAENRTIRDLLQLGGAKVAYYEEDGTHKWGFWQKYMVEALRHFFP